MNGKHIALGMIAVALTMGAGLYYSIEYAYYVPVAPGSAAAGVRLIPATTGQPQAVPATDFQGIDANTSPLRYRACFRLTQSLDTLSANFRTYARPTPLVAPARFPCFDAGAITRALADHHAVAFLGKADTAYGVDRVIAVMDDGRAFAWNQLNHCGEVVYNGDTAPKGCPPAPETN